jgi:hypothetical protein
MDNNIELTREQRLEIEEQAIQALMQMGVKFSVPLKINPVNPPKWVMWWNRLFPNHIKVWRDKRLPKSWDVSVEEMPDTDKGKLVKTYVRHFHVKPFYLGTIDYIRKLYLQIEYDEASIQEQPVQESKKYFKYISLLAEIAAVAVINKGTIANPLDRQTKKLRDFFIEHLTVPRLKRLADVISQMMNAGGFTSSITSIREVGTTKPKTKTENRADVIE